MLRSLVGSAGAATSGVARAAKLAELQGKRRQHQQIERHRGGEPPDDDECHGSLDLASGLVHADGQRQ
jgi:hypothetical protein